MKRIFAFILAILMVFSCCFAESATPTDLLANETEYVEIADDDYGFITTTPKVYLEMSPDTVRLYDEITLIAILVDFPPEHSIYWQYSIDCENWIIIEGEHEQTYVFVVTPENMNYWWRVCVTVEG